MVRDVAISNGAGFVVASMGDIMKMPGLPKTPAAETIDLSDDGEITGLFCFSGPGEPPDWPASGLL